MRVRMRLPNIYFDTNKQMPRTSGHGDIDAISQFRKHKPHVLTCKDVLPNLP